MTFIKDNYRVLVFFIFLMFFSSIMFASGYLTKQMSIDKSEGIEFNCFQYDNPHSCQANITFPDYNISLSIDSNFDKLKVLSNEP